MPGDEPARGAGDHLSELSSGKGYQGHALFLPIRIPSFVASGNMTNKKDAQRVRPPSSVNFRKNYDMG